MVSLPLSRLLSFMTWFDWMCTAHLSRRRVTEMDRWELSTCFFFKFYLTLREEMYVGPTRRDGCVMSKKKILISSVNVCVRVF